MTGKRTQISTPGSPTSGNDFHGSSKDQDRLLPIANVGRIMKKSLPSNAKISKEAKEMVQECVSDFINFITGEASDKCQREKRKTINGEDLLWAMTTLGFQNYVGSLKTYLNKYVGSTSDSACDASVNEIGSEVHNWTPIQPTSEGSHDPYHERVTRYGDDLINMVKVNDTKTVAMTHGQEFEW